MACFFFIFPPEAHKVYSPSSVSGIFLPTYHWQISVNPQISSGGIKPEGAGEGMWTIRREQVAFDPPQKRHSEPGGHSQRCTALHCGTIGERMVLAGWLLALLTKELLRLADTIKI